MEKLVMKIEVMGSVLTQEFVLVQSSLVAFPFSRARKYIQEYTYKQFVCIMCSFFNKDFFCMKQWIYYSAMAMILKGVQVWILPMFLM